MRVLSNLCGCEDSHPALCYSVTTVILVSSDLRTLAHYLRSYKLNRHLCLGCQVQGVPFVTLSTPGWELVCRALGVNRLAALGFKVSPNASATR